jgi:fluoride ion exporter CrcB/FEX
VHKINYEEGMHCVRMSGGTDGGVLRFFKNTVRRLTFMGEISIGNFNINIIWVIVLLIILYTIFTNKDSGCTDTCSVC